MKRYNTKNAAAVMSAMRLAGRPLSVKELTRITKIRIETVKQIIHRLIEDGRVRVVDGVAIPPCYAPSDAASGPLLYQVGESLYWKSPDGFRASYTVEITVGDVAKEGEVRHEL